MHALIACLIALHRVKNGENRFSSFYAERSIRWALPRILLLMIARKTIMSGSAGQIFTIFSPYKSALGVWV